MLNRVAFCLNNVTRMMENNKFRKSERLSRKSIIERLYAEGYEVVTVSELLGADLSAGKIFSRKSE